MVKVPQITGMEATIQVTLENGEQEHFHADLTKDYAKSDDPLEELTNDLLEFLAVLMGPPEETRSHG